MFVAKDCVVLLSDLKSPPFSIPWCYQFDDDKTEEDVDLHRELGINGE